MVTIQDVGTWLAADQAITSNATLTNITGFVSPIEANRTYGFSADIQFNLAGVVSGLKFGVAGPASPTNLLYNILVTSSGSVGVGIGLSASVSAPLATTGLHMCRVSGVIENGANAGNISIQAAQAVSDGSAITIKRGSSFRVWNLS